MNIRLYTNFELDAGPKNEQAYFFNYLYFNSEYVVQTIIFYNKANSKNKTRRQVCFVWKQPFL